MTTMSLRVLLAAALVLLVACGDSDGRRGAVDAGLDAGPGTDGAVAGDAAPADATVADAGSDVDGGVDAGPNDAGVDACVAETYWPDADGDGYGDSSASPVESCVELADHVTNGDDCDDDADTVHPGTTETVGDAGDVDEDCDGSIACYVDADDDGYRVDASVTSSDGDCDDPGEARASDPAGDCNDLDSSVSPGATETVGDPGGIDEDCDGSIECYVDADDDGYRVDASVTSSDGDCYDPGEARSEEPSGDCDDGDASVHPGATEICANAVDDDCDGGIDDLPECSIACDWIGARWLTHGWDGSMAYDVGVWVSCMGGEVTYIERVGTTYSATPTPSGTGDVEVGCNWSSTRWASQGSDGSYAFRWGADLTCAGGRVTSIRSTASSSGSGGTARPGDLACNWTGAIFVSHGLDGACAFQTGFEITCHSGRITHFRWVSTAPCPPVPT